MRRRVSVQEGSPPPLACTAEVGFFYIDMYIHIQHTRAYAHVCTCTWRESGQEDEDENEDEKDEEEEEIGTDIRGHTEFLTSPSSL